MKDRMCTIMGMSETANAGPGRKKMSDGVTTHGNPNHQYADVGDEAASFSDADGVVEGLSRRTPMNYESAYRDSLGVNSKSRGKYNGS